MKRGRPPLRPPAAQGGQGKVEREEDVGLEAERTVRVTQSGTRPGIGTLGGPDRREVGLEDVRAPLRVVIEIAIQGDVNVDRHDVVAAHRLVRRAARG